MPFELQDAVDNLSQKAGVAGASKPQTAPKPELKAWRQILLEEFGTPENAEKFQRFLIKAGVYKDISTPDVGPVRVVGLYPVISQIQNPETKFLNILKQNPVFRFTDYQERIVEENIVTDQLSPFNMDGTLPATVQSALSQRSATLTALGQGMNLSWMAQELAKQGPYNRNEAMAQLQKAFTRLERTMNSMLLSNTEQTSEVPPNIPQLGGFVTRSVSNGQATGGSNLTDNFIQTAIANIANSGFGYDQLTDLAMLSNVNQVGVVDQLMINRYPGNDPVSKLTYEEKLARGAALAGDTYYKDQKSGKVIPIIREGQLPAGTSLLFRTDAPRLGMFQFQGSFGPHVVSRPVTPLFDYDIVFVLFGLIDPQVVGRAPVTGHP